MVPQLYKECGQKLYTLNIIRNIHIIFLLQNFGRVYCKAFGNDVYSYTIYISLVSLWTMPQNEHFVDHSAGQRRSKDNIYIVHIDVGFVICTQTNYSEAKLKPVIALSWLNATNCHRITKYIFIPILHDWWIDWCLTPTLAVFQNCGMNKFYIFISSTTRPLEIKLYFANFIKSLVWPDHTLKGNKIY